MHLSVWRAVDVHGSAPGRATQPGVGAGYMTELRASTGWGLGSLPR
jgi:hypothetical protein